MAIDAVTQLLLIAIAAGLWTLAWALRETQKLQARRIALVDEQARERLILNPDGWDGRWPGPLVEFCDENGKTRLELHAVRYGAGVWLHDENGESRLNLVATQDGQGVWLRDQNGKPRLPLTLLNYWPPVAVHPVVWVEDDNGKARLRLAVDEDGPRLVIQDENEKLIWSAP